MKTIKKQFAVLAMLLAVTAAFAFKPATHKTQDDQAWEYDGSGSVTDESNYVPATAMCEGNTDICGVLAPADGSGNHPVFSTALESRITAKNTTQGDVFLKN